VDFEATSRQALEEIARCADASSLRAVEREYVGRKGTVTSLLATLPTLEPRERRELGRNANRLKQVILEAVEARSAELAAAEVQARRSDGSFDATLPPAPLDAGSLHPITQVTRELEDLFESMGYAILDGPEVELDFYNFEALNIGRDHPARDSQDTFYCGPDDHLLLRTHTSPVQVRAMQTLTPPFRVIAPGRVFRNEATDATHDHTFFQMEGMVVDRGISLAHMLGAMKTLLRKIFGLDPDVRLRPGYFPFVEPGIELDARCPFCREGCNVCKARRWIELLPCGLVHPHVLRSGGIDPDEWSGFAFGLGLSRLVMLRFGINDVRLLLGSDIRFLEQF